MKGNKHRAITFQDHRGLWQWACVECKDNAGYWPLQKDAARHAKLHMNRLPGSGGKFDTAMDNLTNQGILFEEVDSNEQ